MATRLKMIVVLLQHLYLSFRRHGADGRSGGGQMEGVGGGSRVGKGATLKSDKLLKIAFTQSFLFGHTWHIWL